MAPSAREIQDGCRVLRASVARPTAGAAICALAGMIAAKNKKPIDVKVIT
jgi:hypothetical protein